jgi:hypothetical protein
LETGTQYKTVSEGLRPPGAGSVWPPFIRLSWEKRKKPRKTEKLVWIILISMVTALRVCVENVARREDTSTREGKAARRDRLSISQTRENRDFIIDAGARETSSLHGKHL